MKSYVLRLMQRAVLVGIGLIAVSCSYMAASERPQISDQPAPASDAQGDARHGAHLNEWVRRHANLSQVEMLRALDQEPGFNELPPAIQAKYREEAVRVYKQIHGIQTPPRVVPIGA